MRALLHRWLVEYNPLYLLSAALVLGGLTLISQSAAEAAMVHLLGQTGWLPEPRTAFEWGVASIGAGFAVLLVSLVASFRLSRRPAVTSAPAPHASD